MKVLLVKDVYKLGLAGDVKKVAAGYGRNYLLPQGLAVLATPGALKQADRIRDEATVQRANLNQELSGAADILTDVQLNFPAKAGEGEKLYGSITTRMIAEALKEETGVEVTHKQIHSQPIRTIGVHSVDVRLTVDLVPAVTVIVYREGETAQMLLDAIAAAEAEAAAAEALEEEAGEVEGSEEAFDEVIEASDESEPADEAEPVDEVTEEPEAADEAEPVDEVTAEPEAADEAEPVDEAEDVEEVETPAAEPEEDETGDEAAQEPAEDPEEVLEADE